MHSVLTSGYVVFRRICVSGEVCAIEISSKLDQRPVGASVSNQFSVVERSDSSLVNHRREEGLSAEIPFSRSICTIYDRQFFIKNVDSPKIDSMQNCAFRVSASSIVSMKKESSSVDLHEGCSFRMMERAISVPSSAS